MVQLRDRKSVDEVFWEPGILGSYRPPGMSVRESIASAFYLNNETLNIWTHAGALFLYLCYLYSISRSMDMFSDNQHNPLLCVFISSCLYAFCSVVAHTFNAMSELSHHAVFMIDYLGISLYGFGSAVSNMAYTLPKEWRGSTWEDWYLLVNAITSVLSIFCSCMSRFKQMDLLTTKFLRLVGFILSYITSMSPVFYRVVISYNRDDATFYYALHFLFLFLMLVIYTSHFPEIVFPGYFDVFFHSHQLFHVCGAFGTYYKLKGILVDIDQEFSIMLVGHSLFWMGMMAILNSLVCVYFIYKRCEYHEQVLVTPAVSQSKNGSHKRQ